MIVIMNGRAPVQELFHAMGATKTQTPATIPHNHKDPGIKNNLVPI
jgi:hypothetical protein